MYLEIFAGLCQQVNTFTPSHRPGFSRESALSQVSFIVAAARKVEFSTIYFDKTWVSR